MKRFLITLSIVMLASLTAHAQIDAAYRDANAVVLYDFAETSGDIIDKSKIGTPLNLKIYNESNAGRPGNALVLPQANVVRSINPADKITNACKASGAMSIEMNLTNAETVILRSGEDSGKRPQPLRIMALSKGLFDRNFVLGLFYKMGNTYNVGVNTIGNEPNAGALGNSLKDPLESTPTTTIVPDVATGRTVSSPQKVIFTLGPSGVGRLYLSDRNGTLYLAHTETTGFGSGAAGTYLSTWKTGSYLTLGNESMSPTEFSANLGRPDNFTGCNATRNASDFCFTNPNRWWKGRITLAAVYCNEIPKDVVLGSGLPSLLKAMQFDLSNIPAMSANRKRAIEIYNRIASIKTPVTNPKLDDMENLVAAGDFVGAAAIATEDKNFLNITARDFAAKFSNRDLTINTPLNDFTATFVGAIRDGVSAQKLLTDDITYVGNTSAPVNLPVPSDVVDDMLLSNNHYAAIESGRYDLGLVLTRKTQQVYSSRLQRAVALGDESAGVFTSRQWMKEHAIAGTSRRLVHFALQEFLCSPLERIADASGPDDVVGADIDRFPGGSHGKYTTNCRGCHTIMDGFRPAWSKWTFSNNFAKNADFTTKFVPMNQNDTEDTSMGMQMSPDGIAYKNNKNADVYKDACASDANSIGCMVRNQKWVNNANRGSNASRFAWTKAEGTGLKAFGQAIAESQMFQKCMAEKVFRTICKRAPQSLDTKMLDAAAKEFATVRNYNLKFLFQKIGSSDECLGGFNE